MLNSYELKDEINQLQTEVLVKPIDNEIVKDIILFLANSNLDEKQKEKFFNIINQILSK